VPTDPAGPIRRPPPATDPAEPTRRPPPATDQAGDSTGPPERVPGRGPDAVAQPGRAPQARSGSEQARLPDRDRDPDGRPEQTRPRDRTGRPLPYGTTGVATIEDHRPASIEEALALGRRLWNEQRFFESHECLEVVWKAAEPDDADLWQGVIQIAVAAVHLQRGNPSGARTLLERARQRLTGHADGRLGIAVDDALATCRRLSRALERGDVVDAAAVGRFPARHPPDRHPPDPRNAGAPTDADAASTDTQSMSDRIHDDR
jgi:uncharacterized protein